MPEGQTFDRIVTIEMFEHMKNYDALFNKVRDRYCLPSCPLLFTTMTAAFYHHDRHSLTP
jgi:cyclopropane fatty-acyl-phospholipid synthase-like methyltransferase